MAAKGYKVKLRVLKADIQKRHWFFSSDEVVYPSFVGIDQVSFISPSCFRCKLSPLELS